AYMAAVDEKTGALYVLTRQNGGYPGWEKALGELSSWEADAQGIDTLAFAGKGGPGGPFFAPALFRGPPPPWRSRWPRSESLLRVEDTGDKLKIAEDLADRAKTAAGYAARMAVDPEADLVYINNGWAEHLRYNGLTGEYAGELGGDGRPKPIVGSELCVRRDGMIYRSGPTYSGTFSR